VQVSEEQPYQWITERQIHYPMITEVALSPDGRRVVYVVREPLMTDEKSEYITHLYLASTEGGEPIQLTFGEHSERCPRWSPDGRYVAFLSAHSGKDNLYAMRADGGEAWPLTKYEKTGIQTIEWAPDGESIAFLMPEPHSEEKEKAEKAKDDPILWDVDFDFTHLYRVPFAVGPRELSEARQITVGRFHVLNVDWFPDGTRLAIAHRPTPVDEDWPETRLAVVQADVPEDQEGYDLDDLTDVALLADWLGDPKVSPDGAWIACATGEQPIRWALANRVVLYPVDGGEPRPLAVTADAQIYLLGWSADGSQVYGFEPDGVDSQVWALPTSGEAGRQVTDTPLYKGPFSLNGSDQIAFAGQDFHQPNTILVLDGRAGESREVLAPAMPRDWPDAALPRAEVIRWQAPDGLEIEGILTYPLDYQPGERYPLVVEVHGGPAGVYGRQYLGWPGRYCNIAEMAERGFCVLRCNPRGSSGYGKAFRFANRGDWGGGDYRDIMAGVDHLIEQGIADPERMGILGWSYGGYMTSWVITRTDRFGAACVGAGVTNLMSFNGTSDIAGFIPDYFDAEFWEDLEPYRQHSALFQVKGVKTPTLIQHGQNDIRVPLSQGRELYNALKRQGVPVEMVIYPRQGHGIAEPRLRLDVRRRAIAWFVRWLLDEKEENE
jgi:dipeptidyl aminopeptidase/acylaminoacyl peptidase